MTMQNDIPVRCADYKIYFKSINLPYGDLFICQYRSAGAPFTNTN